ncbi:PPE domain-containing protein [Umezawaea sp. Da 62-37]|uniref:PPE domain-containing protein n=1 Tax=Umezawaea sp. Da 62-37 TaxID=3075927 RepID=UPI0028F6FE6C|nr:PPE domain-containing protein [Umezawaea sp. Da 62-37]WNV91612.1 PPE domain-containing protein [Umezawaea sp. Da 62-37]
MVDRKKDSPPNPYPEHKSGKEPSELGEKVDWMTYTHQELYDMVHTGVDLTSAASVKDNWTTLGTTLAEVKDQLIGAIFASSSGWEGESAEKARDGLLTVVKWAENTSDHANNVAECITVEIQHVQTAREQMPPPAPAPAVVTPVPSAIAPIAPAVPATVDPLPVDPLSPVAAPTPTPVTGAQSPFTGIDQVGAPVVGATAAADAGHRTAANVMAAFQQGSFAVDQTVPAFSPPVNPVAPPETKQPALGVDRVAAPTTGAAAPVVGPAIVPPVAGRTQATTSGSSGGGGGGYAPAARGGGYSSGGGYQPSPSFGGGGGGAGGPAAPSGPGGSSGVIGGPDSRAASAQPASAQAPKAGGGSTGGGMMGGAPMAPAPMGSQSDGADHRRARYLEEDDDLFGLDNKAAPPVIGT